MKKLILFIFLTTLFSCENDKGVYSSEENLDENLPNELKGLKIYQFYGGEDIGYVKVAVLNKEINSLTYPHDKTEESVILINKENKNIIEVSKIILETDSLIVCRKY